MSKGQRELLKPNFPSQHVADLPRGFSSQFTMAKERIVQHVLNALAK